MTYQSIGSEMYDGGNGEFNSGDIDRGGDYPALEDTILFRTAKRAGVDLKQFSQDQIHQLARFISDADVDADAAVPLIQQFWEDEVAPKGTSVQQNTLKTVMGT